MRPPQQPPCRPPPATWRCGVDLLTKGVNLDCCRPQKLLSEHSNRFGPGNTQRKRAALLFCVHSRLATSKNSAVVIVGQAVFGV